MQIFTDIRSVELQLFGKLYRLGERRFIVPTARALSHSGDGYLHVLGPALLIALGAPDLNLLLPILATALVWERALYFCIKNSLKRKRPADYFPDFRSIIQASDQFSFPSGHSSAAFLLATTLCLVYGEIFAVMPAWASAVAISRVILGVHFPGDILAGSVMGSTIAAITASYFGAF